MVDLAVEEGGDPLSIHRRERGWQIHPDEGALWRWPPPSGGEVHFRGAAKVSGLPTPQGKAVAFRH